MRSPSTELSPPSKRRCGLSCLVFNILPSGIEYRGAKKPIIVILGMDRQIDQHISRVSSLQFGTRQILSQRVTVPWTCGSDQGRGRSLIAVWLYTGEHRASAEPETETLSVGKNPSSRTVSQQRQSGVTHNHKWTEFSGARNVILRWVLVRLDEVRFNCDL